MKIEVPIYKNGFSTNKKKEIDVDFPICINHTELSSKNKIYLTYLSEKKQISMTVEIGTTDSVQITSFSIDKTHDLGRIYQANGFYNAKNKIIEVDYFKRLLEMERSKIIDLISQIAD